MKQIRFKKTETESEFNALFLARWKTISFCVVGSEGLIKDIALSLCYPFIFFVVPMTIALIWLGFWL
jgi:hypothetical protein